MTSEDRPDLTSYDNHADILKAVAHPVRLMIIDQLLLNPKCVMAIHEILDVRQSNISQHLSILRNSGIVASDRDGSYRCYFLRKPGLVKAVMEALGKEWPETDIEEVRKKFRTALALNKKQNKQGI